MQHVTNSGTTYFMPSTIFIDATHCNSYGIFLIECNEPRIIRFGNYNLKLENSPLNIPSKEESID